MKKLYFAIFLLILAGNSSAQTYFPLLDSANEWSYTTQGIGVRLNPAFQSAPCTYPVNSFFNSFKQFTTSDTIIDSTSYKVVMSSLQMCTMGYIREDTAAGKVYFLDNVSATEMLLYDFSMVVGDTIPIQFIAGGMYVSGIYTLDSITTVNVFAGSRRAFHLNCHSSPSSFTLTWVESVGNLNDVLYPYFDNSSSYGIYSNCPGVQHQFLQFMICFDHNYKVYFDNCAYTATQNNLNFSTFTDSCDYWSFMGALNETYLASGFDIYPNPSGGKSTIDFEATCESDFKISILDLQGKMLLKQIQSGHLHKGKNTIQIDLSELQNGMYIIEIKSVESAVYNKVQIQK